AHRDGCPARGARGGRLAAMSGSFSLVEPATALKASLDARRSGAEVEGIVEAVAREYGALAADALVRRVQVARKHRRMTVAIYDHAFHVIGGGQRYAAALASALQDRFEVTYIVNEEVDPGRVGGWYGIDLSRCKVRLVRL